MTTAKKNYGVVLITGASSGIGRALALEFGARAETLVLVARRIDSTDPAARTRVLAAGAGWT